MRELPQFLDNRRHSMFIIAEPKDKIFFASRFVIRKITNSL